MSKTREQRVIAALSLLTASFVSLIAVFKAYATVFVLLGGITLIAALILSFKVYTDEHDSRATIRMAIIGAVIFAVGSSVMMLINILIR